MYAINTMLRACAARALGDYERYVIVAGPSAAAVPDALSTPPGNVCEIDLAAVNAANAAQIRAQAAYCGEGSICYGIFAGSELAGVCFYWYGERYRQRNFWPLGPKEAKLVQILVAPDVRGRGFAGALIRASGADLLKRGFERLYARIWPSNTSSLAAFASAGWLPIAGVFTCAPPLLSRRLRIVWQPY